MGIYMAPLTKIKALNNKQDQCKETRKKKQQQDNKGLMTRLTEKVGFEVFLEDGSRR